MNTGKSGVESEKVANDVVRPIGSKDESSEKLLPDSLGGEKRRVVTVGATVTNFEASASDELIVGSDFTGRDASPS